MAIQSGHMARLYGHTVIPIYVGHTYMAYVYVAIYVGHVYAYVVGI